MQITENTLYLPALIEYRAEQARRRSIAFCDAPEYVLGTEVRPLCPATFSMLYATRSAFLFDRPAREQDLRNYVWFHSRLYCHCGGVAASLRKRVALARLSLALNQPWRKWLGQEWTVNSYLAMLAIGIAEVNTLIADAFADAPSKSARPGRAVASVEGFYCHEFAMAYGWAPERTRKTPLRQLVQLHRCIRASRGDDAGDDGEDQIMAAHLRAKNEALAAQRAAKAAEKNKS